MSWTEKSRFIFRGPVVGPAVPAPKFAFKDTFRHRLEAGLGFSF